MGGKTWQLDEEQLFWLELVPQSPEGLDPSQRKYSWKEIAEIMHQRLGFRSYRSYNHQLIYEHFYQNCKSNHPSPRARAFVEDYMQRRGDRPIERPKEPKKTTISVKRRTASDVPGPSEFKRARVEPESPQDPGGHEVAYVSPRSHQLLSPFNRGEVAHAASQTPGYDGTMVHSYWSPRRTPLPSARHEDYAAREWASNDLAAYPVPGPSPASQSWTSQSYHGAYPAHRDRNEGQYHTSDGRADMLFRRVSLPPLTLEPRTGSAGPGGFDTARTSLPPFSTFSALADHARPPMLPACVTPTRHNSRFEALLSVVSASSTEASPSSLVGRSENVGQSRSDSPMTTVPDGDETESDGVENATTAATKTVTSPISTEENQTVVE